MAEEHLTPDDEGRNDWDEDTAIWDEDTAIEAIREELYDAAAAVRLCAAEVSIYRPHDALTLNLFQRSIRDIAKRFSP